MKKSLRAKSLQVGWLAGGANVLILLSWGQGICHLREMNVVFNCPSWFAVCTQEFDFTQCAEVHCLVLSTSSKYAYMFLLKYQFHWLQKAAEFMLQVLGHDWRDGTSLKKTLSSPGSFAAEGILLDLLPCQEAQMLHLCLKSWGEGECNWQFSFVDATSPCHIWHRPNVWHWLHYCFQTLEIYLDA